MVIDQYFLNCFIDSGKLIIRWNLRIFPDIYPLGANHLILIVKEFLSVESRILLNFLFEKFMKLSEQRFIQQQMTDVFVDVVQILCGQYLRYFSTTVSVIYMMIITRKFFCSLSKKNLSVQSYWVVFSLNLIKFFLRNLMA